MAETIDISNAMVRKFVNGIDLLQQQRESFLGGRVRNETLNPAEAAEFDQVDAVEMADITTRHRDTVLTDVPHKRRVVTWRPASIASLIDPADIRRVLNNPQSSYAQSFAAASNRKHDRRIIDAFFATAITGKGGTATAAFDATNYEIAAGTTGMSTDKLRQASKKLKQAQNVKDNGLYQWHVGYTAEEQEDLLKETQLQSGDFNVVKALYEGDIKQWMGFEHVVCELFSLDGSSNRMCPAWVKQSMLLAVSEMGRGDIDKRPDKEGAIQVRYENDSGATRMDEKGVVRILAA